MDNRIKTFINLADLFEENGFHLYLVGGSVRDYLLNISLTDMDVVTDAAPTDERKFLSNADFTFEKYGSVKVVFQNVKFDITTLRKESGYSDSRHPSKVEYTDKLEEDVSRRDISINALYLSKDLKVVDLVDGVTDLNNRLIRVLGNPDARFKEDPLRIIRILRFKFDFDLEIEENTWKSLNNNLSLIYLLNKDKVQQEIKKCHHVELLTDCLKELGVNLY